MKNNDLTKEQLVEQISVLQDRINSLEKTVAAQRQTEDALSASENNMSAILEKNADGIVIVDTDGTVLYTNPAAEKLFGKRKEDFLGYPFGFPVSVDKAEDSVIIRKGNLLCEAELHVVPVHWQQRPAFQLSIRDVTKRKEIEALLKDSEERYRRLFETADDGILLLEKHELKIRHANPAITATLGYSNEDCIGKDLKDIGFPDDIGTVNEIMQTLDKDGILYFKDFPLQKKTGQVADADIYMVDRASLVQCNIRNITEFKRMAGELRQSQKMESVGTLAGGIAHDFNNILAIIIGNTEMAIDAVPEWNPAKEYLNEIQLASTRAKDLIRHILSFSHKGSTYRKPIKLGAIIEDLLKLLRATIPADIEILQNLSCESDMILADPTQTGQVLMNLCTNAAHAMHDKGGILEVSLQNVEFKKQNMEFDLGPGRYVKLTLSDTGHGIDPKNIDRIFDPYFTTKGLGEGTGLGLSMVQGIVKMHDGAVAVKSKLGKGTVFDVLFPLTEAESQPENEKAEALPTGNEKILLIDDEESILKLVKRRLEMQGYQVETKNNPVEALELFRSEPDRFDLIITDITMPNLTGDKLAKELLNIRPRMPIILCSGYSDRIDAEKAAAFGIRQYIEKPLNMSDFLISIRKVLDEAKA